MNQANKKVIQFFSAMADETRLKILSSLIEGPRTVNGIHNYVGEDRLTLSAISHQLKHLNDVGIIVYEKNGREKIFKLSDDFCWCILRDAFKHFKHKTKCAECLKLKNRKM